MYMDTTERTEEDYKKADRTVALATLNNIADEIKKSIQDLDYWQDQIKRAVRILENW